MEMTNGQELAIEQLEAIENASNGALEILSKGYFGGDSEWTRVDISIDCSSFARKAGGLRLRARERLYLLIPQDFPFEIPEAITVHTRFGEFPHVQWKHYLCLYQAPSTEWDPSAGMFGFIDRLDNWLAKGALNELDPIGGPLHPPIAYIPTGPVRIVIPNVDTPTVPGEGWFGTAHLGIRSESCVDIRGWSELFAEDTPKNVGAVLLLSKSFPFEYPSHVGQLFDELETRGISRERLFLTLQHAILRNSDEFPLYVILGTPMRGIRGSNDLLQHLTAWYVDPVLVKGLKLAINKYSENIELQRIGEEVEQIIIDWAKQARVAWCLVRENRPEIVARRDHSSVMSWFRNRIVSIWGCGALGGHVAMYLARAGAKKLILRDNKTVAPGILVRQLFEDTDLGRWKASALADHLKRIRPELETEIYIDNILKKTLEEDSWIDEADVIIDTTASESVWEKLELKRHVATTEPIPIASMIVGHQASHGLVVLSRPEHTGGSLDAYRHAKLVACNRPGLEKFADEFWPTSHRELFQPEPGCSDVTFVGSSADIAALAGMMLNCAASELSKNTAFTSSGHFVSQAHFNAMKANANFSCRPAYRILDPYAGYEVRISNSAWNEILAWIQRSSRLHSESVETGGLLFGERNDACKVIWVDEVLGPPPDSKGSADGFICGVEGIVEANNEKRTRTRGSVQFIGMWHTHPNSIPIPSEIDINSMHQLTSSTDPPTPNLLLLIVGAFTAPAPVLGAFVFRRSDFRIGEKSLIERTIRLPIIHNERSPRRVGVALSGGGSRAIAFHLGCLRALNDRGILNQIEVVSAVSGGSVIAAMYAYSHDSFPEFEQRVIKLLQIGLQGSIVRRVFLSHRLLGSLVTSIIAGMAAVGADLLRIIISKLFDLLGRDKATKQRWINQIHSPFRRWVNRTTAFEDVLRREIFGSTLLTDVRRNDMHVVINACDLRTGSAFRFGSKESGSWRFGKLVLNEVDVALAVAASAAYPPLLPAIDKEFSFLDKNGRQSVQRVLLTDGGVFDNLGVTCLEPGRSPQFSYNVHNPEYVISCNAGMGLLDECVYPSWWMPRMVRSFESIFRKAQDSTNERLHRYVLSGELKGLVLAYFGQQDHKLPYIPPDLIKREEVIGYPTDFAPMNTWDIERIAARGEQLTRLLIARYCPDL